MNPGARITTHCCRNTTYAAGHASSDFVQPDSRLSSSLRQVAIISRWRASAAIFEAGTYRQRLTLTSGRFAMIDNGLGFALVPWTPALDDRLGRHVTGVAKESGRIEWNFGRRAGWRSETGTGGWDCEEAIVSDDPDFSRRDEVEKLKKLAFDTT
jgi:hypothetical protein